VKFILQMIVDESAWQDLTPDQMQPMMEAMDRYNDELRNVGAWVGGEGLDFSSAAKTVRANNGERTVTDGPATNAKEQFAGYWIIEVDDIDEAVKWAKEVPMTNGAVEVRALVPEDVPPS
jgi:hypothetical protein